MKQMQAKLREGLGGMVAFYLLDLKASALASFVTFLETECHGRTTYGEMERLRVAALQILVPCLVVSKDLVVAVAAHKDGAIVRLMLEMLAPSEGPALSLEDEALSRGLTTVALTFFIRQPGVLDNHQLSDVVGGVGRVLMETEDLRLVAVNMSFFAEVLKSSSIPIQVQDQVLRIVSSGPALAALTTLLTFPLTPRSGHGAAEQQSSPRVVPLGTYSFGLLTWGLYDGAVTFVAQSMSLEEDHFHHQAHLEGRFTELGIRSAVARLLMVEGQVGLSPNGVTASLKVIKNMLAMSESSAQKVGIGAVCLNCSCRFCCHRRSR